MKPIARLGEQEAVLLDVGEPRGSGLESRSTTAATIRSFADQGQFVVQIVLTPFTFL